MAGSRTHKSFTVFKRVQGLLKADAMEWKDRPVWYDVMERFPPKVPPAYSRPEPTDTVQNIIYPEDLVRAKYYEEYSNSEVANLKVYKANSTTKVQTFIDEYIKLQRPGASIDEIFNEVEEKLSKDGRNYKYSRIKSKKFVEPAPLLHEEEIPDVKNN